jgi:hypothetical protein
MQLARMHRTANGALSGILRANQAPRLKARHAEKLASGALRVPASARHCHRDVAEFRLVLVVDLTLPTEGRVAPRSQGATSSTSSGTCHALPPEGRDR